VRITELEAVRCILGLPVACDRQWRGKKSLEDYAADALKAGHIVARANGDARPLLRYHTIERSRGIVITL